MKTTSKNLASINMVKSNIKPITTLLNVHLGGFLQFGCADNIHSKESYFEKTQNVYIYSNPANTELHILFDKDEYAMIYVKDLLGRIIKTTKINSS